MASETLAAAEVETLREAVALAGWRMTYCGDIPAEDVEPDGFGRRYRATHCGYRATRWDPDRRKRLAAWCELPLSMLRRSRKSLHAAVRVQLDAAWAGRGECRS